MTDIADIIAGELKVSRGTAYDMMRAALATPPLTDQQIEALAGTIPVDELDLHYSTWHIRLARAIERAHGIGGKPYAS